MLESRTPGVHWYFGVQGPSPYDLGPRCALPLFVSFHVGFPIKYGEFGNQPDRSKGRNWNFNVQVLVWTFLFGRRVRSGKEDRP